MTDPNPYKVVKETFIDDNGHRHNVLTCLESKYLLWEQGDRWHWALRNWPDDDLGLANHGSKPTILEAIDACIAHREERRLHTH